MLKILLYLKSLFPKGAKSIVDQNRVINITTLFSLPPTFSTYFWSEYNEQKEGIKIQFWGFHRRGYKLAEKNAPFFFPKSRKWI